MTEANELCQVDAFVLVHAGRGAETTGEARELWSVKWTLPEPREADGKQYHRSRFLG